MFSLYQYIFMHHSFHVLRSTGDWETDFRKGSKWDTGNTGGMALRQVRACVLAGLGWVDIVGLKMKSVRRQTVLYNQT